MVMTSGSFSLMNNFKLFQLEQTGNDFQFQHLICTCFGQKAVFKTVLLTSSKLQILKTSNLQIFKASAGSSPASPSPGRSLSSPPSPSSRSPASPSPCQRAH